MTKAKGTNKLQIKRPIKSRSFLVIVGSIGITSLASVSVAINNYKSVCGFVDNRLGSNICMKDISGGYLKMTPFYTPTGPEPGNDHVLRSSIPQYEGQLVFQSAATLTTYMSRAGGDDSAITISSVALILVRFDPKDIPALDYIYSPENLKGKGITEKLSYRIVLDSTGIRASQIGAATDGSSMSVSTTDLLANRQITLTNKDAPQSLKFLVFPRRSGLYEFYLKFDWSSAGNTRSNESQHVLVYKNES